VSAGRFRRVQGTAPAGPGGTSVPIVVVADASVADDPGAYLRKLVQVLPHLAKRYGPYPYPSYTLALTASLRGGIENPMLVFQGPGSLGRSTSHEAAHMWFYSLVGNDQARDPWLDEGLATWAEAGYEGSLASITGRRIPAGVAGQAGRPTSFYDSRTSSYYVGVYVQGAQALAALGPPDLVDGIRP
jgi:aminopeptidase N